MYFTLSGKKEIELVANCPTSKVLQAIRASIENKKGIFGKNPQKVFCGEENDGLFSLDLNYHYFHKFNPFRRFVCEVSGDGEKCMIKVTFKNDFFLFGIFAIVPILVWGGKTKKWKISAASIVILAVIMTCTFNIKISKCMDEIEYIVEEAENGR